MAAGAREQAASCDAFVLSRRPPAPDAPPSRTSRHDRGRRKTPRDPRCDRAETLAEPGIPSTAAGILLRHHRNPLPRSWRRGGRRCSCSSSAARAETLSDRQEDLRRHPEKTVVTHPKKPPQLRTIPPHPETLRNSEKPPLPRKNRKKP